MKEAIKIDHLIIGGGIVGLLLAKELSKSKRYCNDKICLLENSPYLGDQSTGRNSGVLHAGIYYPTKSLKHLCCIKGNEQWRKLAAKYNFCIKNTGKYIFSNNEESIKNILKQARENNVPEIGFCSVAKINNFVNAKYALFSKTTAILNIPEIVKLLERLNENNGVIILKNHKLNNLSHEKLKNYFSCEFDDFIINGKNIYNVAGLGAISIRKLLGLNDLDNHFIKGTYLKTNQKLNYSSLLYPMPEKNLIGLGIHSTIDFNNDVKFGPNTEIIKNVDYTLNENLVEEMKNDVCSNFKNIIKNKLYGDYAGVRSKIIYKNKIYNDFWIKSPIPNYFEACGIDSPGLTSAPVIAKKILQLKELC